MNWEFYLEWWLLIIIISLTACFVFFILMLIINARDKKGPYENYPCSQCGNFTVHRSPGWSVCDCCGMVIELDRFGE